MVLSPHTFQPLHRHKLTALIIFESYSNRPASHNSASLLFAARRCRFCFGGGNNPVEWRQQVGGRFHHPRRRGWYWWTGRDRLP